MGDRSRSTEGGRGVAAAGVPGAGSCIVGVAVAVGVPA